MYYYTSTETMSKILQGGNIWATNLDYLNDAQEYLNGLKEIRTLLKNKKLVGKWLTSKNIMEEGEYEKLDIDMILSEQLENEYKKNSVRYTISFCKEKDLLSQWTTYAKESGVCLEMQFDLDKDVSFQMYERGTKDRRTLDVLQYPEEILYYTSGRQHSEQERIETEHRILERLFKGYSESSMQEFLPSRWKDVSVFVKQYDFYQEKEYRLVFNTSKNPQIGYRMDKQVLKPYLDIACKNGWPITAIMVGPGFNQNIVFESIKFFLNHEKIKSSALRTMEQWKVQIEEYLRRSEKIDEEWKHWKSAVSRGGTLEEIEPTICELCKTLERWTDHDIEEDERQKLLHQYVLEITEQYPNEYFKQHYFTASGIILEKSMIPYIF